MNFDAFLVAFEQHIRVCRCTAMYPALFGLGTSGHVSYGLRRRLDGQGHTAAALKSYGSVAARLLRLRLGTIHKGLGCDMQ